MKTDTFKVEEWMNEYEQYCQYDLGNSTVQTLSLDELFSLSKINKHDFCDKLCSQKLGYGCIKGSPKLKNGVANLYKTITPDDIVPTNGAAGANYLVFYSLIEPSDRVISVIPTYQQLYSIPKSFGADVQFLYLKPENKFLPDIQELEKLVTKNTKLICINNPNNPTGALMDEDMLQQIADIARSVNAFVLSDEVYRGLNIGEEKTPSMADIYEKGISVCSMSKIFSLAGLRLGWIACKDKSFINSCFQHREYNMISCSIPDEMLASAALDNAELITERNRNLIKQCNKILAAWLNNEGKEHFSCVMPRGGTTALIYYDLDMPSYKFCDALSKQHGVFLTPGCCFELENCFRAGYCTDKSALKEGLLKISSFSAQL